MYSIDSTEGLRSDGNRAAMTPASGRGSSEQGGVDNDDSGGMGAEAGV